MVRLLIRAGLVLVASLWLSGCGGGGDPASPGPGVATVGAAGGTLVGDDGAQVVFPKDALRSDTTVRIARDSTGAPPLPSAVLPGSAVYSITPHGGAFDEQVEVSIPVDAAALADGGQLLLVSAEPGDTQWRVLSGASYTAGKMRAPVMHFSFFQVITLVNQIMPTLTTKIDGANNFGGAGVGLLSPLAKLPFLTRDINSSCGRTCPIPINTLVAELSFPALITQPTVAPRGIPAAPVPTTNCRPVDLGHNAMSFRFTREGSQVFAPTVDHPAVVARDPWPRFPGDGGELGFSDWTTLGWGTFPGFGAIHYYGNESPRIFGLYDANPPTQAQRDRADAEQNSTAGRYVLPNGNIYALPPVGDSAADNLYTWRGTVHWVATQNGSVRIDAAIMTTCGLLLEARPLAFKLDAPPTQGYRSEDMVPVDYYGTASSVAEGSDATRRFALLATGGVWTVRSGLTYRVDFTPDPSSVDWQPVPASAVSSGTYQITDPGTFATRNASGVTLSLPAVRADQAGYYRVFWCAPEGCFDGKAYHLTVVQAPPTLSAQPAGQTVQVGETASFTVAAAGAPAPALQWQKRSFVAAAFGFLAWADIPGATAGTYTTPPLALADTATQYRAVARNALGEVASDAAMLTVVEQFAPPVILAQPGSLNVTNGGSAVFAATVDGAAPLSYQWRRNGSNITGANSSILTLSNVSALNDGRYDLVVSNRAGSVTSDAAVLVVAPGTPVALAPTIAAAPASISVAEGNAANFAVAVNGTGPYTFAWLKDGVLITLPNADAPSFGIAAVSTADAGSYAVRVSNSAGTVTSVAATLSVVPGGGVLVAPAITTAPSGLAVLPGAGATLAVAASGTAPLSYQWRRNGIDVPGGNAPVLHFAAVSALDAGQYSVEVRNAAGAAASPAVPLVVVGAPAISQQPAAASASEGASASFEVVAVGDGVAYQWTRNQVAIPGATAARYTTPALTPADSGVVYGVIVYNGAGLVFSQGAVLTVSAAPAAARSWQTAGLIEANDPGDAAAPQVAINATGDGMAAWSHFDGTRNNIWANRYTAATGWGTPALIETDAGDASLPQVAIDASGNATVVWQQLDANGRSNIWANRYAAGLGWGTAVAIETNGPSAGDDQLPRIAIGANGDVIAVWELGAYTSTSVWANRYVPGTGWGTAVQIGTGNPDAKHVMPQVAVDSSGNGMVVWTQYNGSITNVWGNRFAVGAGWGPAALIQSDSASSGRNPGVALDASGNGMAVWAQFDVATSADHIWASRYSVGTGWAAATRVQTSNLTQQANTPKVAFDAAGNAITVWNQGAFGANSVYAARYAVGSGWGTELLIETHASGSGVANAAVGMDAGGHAVAVWQLTDANGFMDVRANRYTVGAGWGTATPIEPANVGSGQSFSPQVAVSAGGDALVVWRRRNPTRFDIWANSYK